MDEVGRSVDGIEHPQPFSRTDVGLLHGFFSKQIDLGRGLGEVIGDVALNREVSVGYGITVTLVVDGFGLRRFEGFDSNLRCLPSDFEKILVVFHVPDLPRFQLYSNM
jgi:hypothetical protein